MQRRQFLYAGTSAAVSAAWAAQLQAQERKVAVNDKVTICVMGVKGRGYGLLQTFSQLPDINIKYVCDLDPAILGQRLEYLNAKGVHRPQGIKDYRTAIDDKSVDAFVIGTPDHWHALPTIHACQAGKDVYVEKPDGHNILEGRAMVRAQQKYNRVVQLGTQARSGLHLASAMEYLQAGHLGKVRFAKAWESSKQGTIGNPPDSAPPPGVDYDLWLGPAPKHAFNVRRFHGNWRWFYDYGSGDLGNDGVHRLDIARWGLATALAAKQEKLPPIPVSISSLGGKMYFDDAQEWPDTQMVTYDYGPALLTYEMRVWSAYPLHEEPEGAAILGDAGYMVLGNSRWRAFDAKGKLVREEAGSYNDVGHAQNFLDCMRSRGTPAADLATVGHPSSLLCHLGNVAWRAGRTVKFDATKYEFVGDRDANQYLTRPEYRKPFELPDLG
ncbi:MAG TPA: Gfo/Idh/MocA family oxidoreductase [Pirellulaceae bacterium]|nr:Gfo/Idh/MocA family oxidoreductase [Pirellulaceae bacterium]